MLVIATGAVLQPEETEGMTGPGWREHVFTSTTFDGAAGWRDALERFEGGRLVVNFVDLPIKCPVAPLEFSFLADWYLRKRGVRDRVELTLVTPLDGAFTKPIASAELATCSGARTSGSRPSSRPARSTARAGSSVVRRPRGSVRPARDRSAARGRRVRGALAPARRRSRLRPH